MSWGRRGDEEVLLGRGRGGAREVPNSFFEARLIARLRALVAARDARLDGDEEREGAWG